MCYGPLRRIWLCAVGHRAEARLKDMQKICHYRPLQRLNYVLPATTGNSFALWGIDWNLVMRYVLPRGICSVLWPLRRIIGHSPETNENAIKAYIFL
jgi:hypothetical protein